MNQVKKLIYTSCQAGKNLIRNFNDDFKYNNSKSVDEVLLSGFKTLNCALCKKNQF